MAMVVAVAVAVAGFASIGCGRDCNFGRLYSGQTCGGGTAVPHDARREAPRGQFVAQLLRRRRSVIVVHVDALRGDADLDAAAIAAAAASAGTRNNVRPQNGLHRGHFAGAAHALDGQRGADDSVIVVIGCRFCFY